MTISRKLATAIKLFSAEIKKGLAEAFSGIRNELSWLAKIEAWHSKSAEYAQQLPRDGVDSLLP